MVDYRVNLSFINEFKEIFIADAVLSIAFTLYLIGGFSLSALGQFEYFFPISVIAISFSFVLHELMHKFTAQRFGAIAAFKSSTIGLAITLIPSLVGILIGLPGATYIYTNKFTKEENGIVSLAGPLTNFAVFMIFLAAGMLMFRNFLPNVTSSFSSAYVGNTYLQNLVNITLFTSIILAFFNMLPIYPLDGSKVLMWNSGVYSAMIVTIFALLLLILPILSLIFSLMIMLVLAYFLSKVSRMVLF